MNKKIVLIGFWGNAHHPELPFPHASIFDNSEPLRRLRLLEASIKENPQPGNTFERYRGISICRICEEANGCGEYTYESKGVTYRWPDGFAHYLEKHCIEPPAELRELLDYHELKFKVVREGALMELFPFNISNARENDAVVSIWNDHRPKGTMWNSIGAQVQSKTRIRLCVRADGVEELVFDKEIDVEEEQLAGLIRERKHDMAYDEYKNREQFICAREVGLIMKSMFGE